MSKKRRNRGRSGHGNKRPKASGSAAGSGSSGGGGGTNASSSSSSGGLSVSVGDAINAVLLEREGAASTAPTSRPKAFGAALFKALVRGSVISRTPSSSAANGHKSDMSVDRFFKGFWGRKPVAIRPTRAIHELLACGKEDVRGWFKSQGLLYGRDLDVTNYIDGERHTYNDDGVAATAEKILDESIFGQGKSLRILRPQQYSRPCWRMLTCLEAYFGRGGGSNLYLTPGSNQGFAGHYDDIEAVLVQIEGRKAWTVYREYAGQDPDAMSLFPKNPRFSSGNFTAEQLEHLDVAFNVTLEPGDVLYLPRGAVHHARTPETDEYSLHVTFSIGQMATFADLLIEALPRALELALDETQPESDSVLRESLPIGFQDYIGVSKSDLEDNPDRQAFLEKAAKMFTRVLPYLPIDAAADFMDRKFLHDRHSLIMVAPPHGKSDTKAKAKSDDDDSDTEDDDAVAAKNKRRFLLRVEGAQNLSVEGNAVLLYHSQNNTRVFHEADPAGIEFGFEDTPAIEELMNAVSKPVAFADIPHDSDGDRERVVSVLLDQKVIVEV